MNVLILGQGRIARAISYYLKRSKLANRVSLSLNGKQAQDYNLLVGALPAGLGELSLKLALKYKKDLIDLADLETNFYLKYRRKIQQRAITVIAGCGFCPGLVNFILGREILGRKNIRKIQVQAGSLSGKEFYFPFLWCFEDLVAEFLFSSRQLISGKTKTFPAFGGYRQEKFFGIPAESYFAQSGFENLLQRSGAGTFTYRNIRPRGFYQFFQFLKNHQAFSGKNMAVTKELLETRLEDNLSLAQIEISAKGRNVAWQMKSFSRKSENLNSMQKITGLFAAEMIQHLISGRLKEQGLLFCEDIGRDEDIFRSTLDSLNKKGIRIYERKNF